MEENKDLATQQNQAMEAYDTTKAYGFEETDVKDIVIPRIKVIQALSPERIDGIASEGDILNSLTQEKSERPKVYPCQAVLHKYQMEPGSRR